MSTSTARGLQPSYVGKVRDVYDFGKQAVIVTTDRVSAFDVVMRQGVPHKGRVLNGLSKWWMEKLNATHQVTTYALESMEGGFHLTPDVFAGRTVLVNKLDIIPVEFVVRGYLCGTGWKEYKEKGTLAGEPMPRGLQENMRLFTPVLTPTTKAPKGENDRPITCDEMTEIVHRFIFGDDAKMGVSLDDDKTTRSLVTQITRNALSMFEEAGRILWDKGIILADTKLEYGNMPWGSRTSPRVTLADECFTPDSSRLWEFGQYRLGGQIASLDKQYLRDYLTGIGWDKKSPPPDLPADVVKELELTYLSLYERITGSKLEGV